MSIPVSENLLTSEVAPSREQTLSVSRSNVFLHVCDITLSGAAVRSFYIQELLPPSFLEGKGQVSLISMTAKASLDTTGGSVGMAITSINSSFSGLTGIRTIPNRFMLGVNPSTINCEVVCEMVVPTGVARQIFPTSSALPAPVFSIGANAKASGYVTLVIEVSCTGPFLSSSAITLAASASP